MNYTYAVEVKSGRPAYVLQTDSKVKNNCFVALSEVPMTLDKATKIAKKVNSIFSARKEK